MRPDRIDFLHLFCPSLLKAGKDLNIPQAALIIAAVQGGTETATEDPVTKCWPWGTSPLWKLGWNFGGMQAFSGMHDTLLPLKRMSSEVINGKRVPKVELFRQFASAEDAIAAWWRTITTSMISHPASPDTLRYQAALGALKSGTLQDQVVGFAHGLEAAGYSTTPGYGNSLLELVRECNLMNGLEQYA